MRLSLAHKLMIGFLLMGVFPLVVGVILFSGELTRYQQQTTEALARVRAERVGDLLAAKVSTIVDTLRLLQRYLPSPGRDRELLQLAYDRHPELLGLAVTDSGHRVTESLYRYGFKPRGTLMQHDDDVMVSFVQWHLEPQLRIHLPLRDLMSDERRGTLHAEISLKRLFSELPGSVDATSYIVSSEGRVVSHPDINHVLNGLDLSSSPLIRTLIQGAAFASGEYPDPDGRQVFGVGIRVPGLPLFVVEEVPAGRAYQLSRELSRRAEFILAGVLLVLLLAALLLPRKITRPLVRLERATRRVAGGNLDVQIGRLPHLIPDELDDLARRFDHMVLALRRDRSRRERAERQLQRLQDNLRDIIDSMPSVLIGVDTSLRVTQWNREAVAATGATAEEAMGRPLTEVYPAMGPVSEKIRQAMQRRRPLVEKKVGQRQGEGLRHLHITIYPLTSDGVEGAVVRVDDITEQVRIEEVMIQSEKMLTVGGLAAGMAHEINNPLAGILQNLQVFRNRLGGAIPRNREQADACGITMEQIGCYLDGRGLPRLLDAMQDSGERAARIVSNMLSFSRMGGAGFLPVDLNDLLEKSLELAGSEYDLKKRFGFRDIRIERDFDPALPPVPCDAGKIQQVLLNLLKNAAQALAGETQREEAPRIVLRSRAEGDWVRLEVEDNGPGMPEQVRRRIFEPFFTTKEVGKGTGLGLSVSYFIIHENHGGSLSVDSEPGRGSRFVIRLPLKRDDSDA